MGKKVRLEESSGYPTLIPSFPYLLPLSLFKPLAVRIPPHPTLSYNLCSIIPFYCIFHSGLQDHKFSCGFFMHNHFA